MVIALGVQLTKQQVQKSLLGLSSWPTPEVVKLRDTYTALYFHTFTIFGAVVVVVASSIDHLI